MPVEMICQGCGEMFMVPPSRGPGGPRERQFCGRACSNAAIDASRINTPEAYAKRTATKAPVIEAGRVDRRNRRSRACALKQMSRPLVPPSIMTRRVQQRRCGDCGADLRRTPWRGLCASCRSARPTWTAAARDRRRGLRRAGLAERGSHRKRAQLHGVEYQAGLTLRWVADRAGWVCGLCMQPVDPELRHPDPLSASIDHVIPFAQGGAHTADNVQLAHLKCNVLKGGAAQ